MAMTKIGPKHQITIPQEAFELLDLQPGDVLEVQVRDGYLQLVPQRLIPRDQAWFWSPEWQASEREASEAIETGNLSGPFETLDDVLAHLHGT